MEIYRVTIVNSYSDEIEASSFFSGLKSAIKRAREYEGSLNDSGLFEEVNVDIYAPDCEGEFSFKEPVINWAEMEAD